MTIKIILIEELLNVLFQIKNIIKVAGMSKTTKIKSVINKIPFILLFISIFLLYSFNPSEKAPRNLEKSKSHPRIVNIINFIRLLEPRDAKITEEVLYETVVKQIEMMKKYKLGGTFLLQYDALIDPRYQKLSMNHEATDLG